MPQTAPRTERPYAGVGRTKREAERRARLIEAAIAVYGEVGFKNASVRSVCQAAGLSERYFYEAFANSEALFIATYEQVNERLIALVEAAGVAPAQAKEEAMLTAFFLELKQRPREAHLFLVEVRGVSPAVDAAIAVWLDRFGDLLVKTLKTPQADHLLVRGTVGGLLHLAIAWLESNAVRPVSDVVEQALIVCAGLRSVAD